MKYPVSALKQSIYSALSGNITVANMRGAGNVTPAIYDSHIPKSAVYPYVLMQNFNTTEYGTKSSFSTEVVGVLNIVTSSDGDYGGAKQSEDIANAILSIIDSNNTLTVSGQNNYIIHLESSDAMVTNDGTNTLFRKMLRYRFYLEQN